MKNILLTRIDDRLLHGQVVISWIPHLKVNEVIIVDEEYSSDEFLKNIIKESSPDNIITNVFSPKETAKYLEDEFINHKVLILSRNIENIEKMLEFNIELKKINIGNLCYKESRSKQIGYIFLSEREYETLKKIEQSGITVEVQMLPKDKPINI